MRTDDKGSYAWEWVNGLDDQAFLAQVRLRKLSLLDIIQVLPYHPVGRTPEFFDFVVEELQPSANELYAFVRQVNMSAFVDAFLVYARKTQFPSSMLAWLLKEKKMIEHEAFFNLFLDSRPSASDFCWVFGEFPAMKTHKYVLHFMRSQPSHYHIDYLVKTLHFNAEWLSDEDELDKVFQFYTSLPK
jgi:hypothetical protein